MVQPRRERAKQEALRRLAQMRVDENGAVIEAPGDADAALPSTAGLPARGTGRPSSAHGQGRWGSACGGGRPGSVRDKWRPLSARECAESGRPLAHAAQKAAAFTLASTLGAFGSSQLTVETALAAEAAAGIVAESPAAVASAGDAGAGSEGSAGATGDASGSGSAGGSSGTSSGSGSAGTSSGGTTGNTDGSAGSDASTGTPSTGDGSAGDASTGDASAGADAGFDADGGAGTDTALDSETGLNFALASEDVDSADDPDADAEVAPLAATLTDRIQEALAAGSSAVVALEDGDALDAQVAVPAGRQLTIDLNGRALSASAGGAAFKLGGGSTLTVIDNSAGKGGSVSTGAALVEQDEFDYTKCNLVVQGGSISCSSLVGFANCAQVTLTGGSVSMTSTMRVTSDVWVDIKGSCSVRSSTSDCAFRIAGGGSVTTLANAHVTYTGNGSMFRLLKGGVLELGSGAGCGVVLNAANGGIVAFDSSSVNASYDGATIVCGKDHPVFSAGSAGAGATVKFVSGVLPDDSIKSFLGGGSFCVYEPDKGFVVCGQSFINDNCIGTADDVYYYTEDSFANATGDKVRFLLVEFSFDASDFAGTSLAGKTAHIHVPPGTVLRNAPLFELMEAPARDGFTFRWVLEGTGVGYLPDEVLAIPLAAGGAYSFVGGYVADHVEPPAPETCDVEFRWGGAYCEGAGGPAGPDAGDAQTVRHAVEKGKTLAGKVPGDDQVRVAGYRFCGWFDEGGRALDAAAPVQGDAVYTARYEKEAAPDPGPEQPVEPVEPDPGPGQPVDPGPTDPGPGTGESGGGTPGGAPSTPGAPGGAPVNPFMPWNPPGLALAAGFTMPTGGPGVVMRELESTLAAEDAGGADGDALELGLRDALAAMTADAGSEADAAGASDDAQGAERPGMTLPLGASDLALLAGLAAGVVLVALIASRAAAFLAATRRRA